MTKLRSALVLSILLILLSSSRIEKQTRPFDPIETKISGQVFNIGNDSLLKIFYMDLGLGTIDSVIKIDNSGRFNISLKLPYPQTVQVKYKVQYSVNLMPGDSIFMEINSQGNNDVRYMGISDIVALNNTKAQYRIFWNGYYWRIYFDLMNKQTELPPYEYKILANSYRKELLDSIKKFCEYSNASKAFKDYAETEVNFKIGDFMVMIPLEYSRKMKIRLSELISKDYKGFSDSLLFDLSSNISDSYKLALAEDFLVKYTTALINDVRFIPLYKKNNLLAVFDTVFQEVGGLNNPDLSSLLTSRLCVKLFKEGGGDIVKQLYPKYRSNIIHPYYKQQVESIIDFADSRSKVDETVSESSKFLRLKDYKQIESIINLADSRKKVDETVSESNKFLRLKDYKQMTNLIDSILTTDKKYIYIDVWATWCGPCKKEFNYSNSLHEKVSKDVKFVYLCIESNRLEWADYIRKQKLDGEHFLLTTDQAKYLSEVLKIDGIPRYFLLDNKGKVLDMNMTRPSDPKTIERLKN